MKARVVVPLLALGTIAIGVENWLYFSADAHPLAAASSEADGADVEGDELAAGSGGALEAEAEPPPLLGLAELAALLESFDGLRSPFLPDGAEHAEELGLPRFAGLLIGGDRRVAWLGDHARSEGELYQGFSVTRVEASRVVLERGGRRYSLWLDPKRAHEADDSAADPALASDEETLP